MTGFDVHEVVQLAVELDVAAVAVLPAVREVIQKGALNIKKDAQARVSGLRHVPGAPRAITYDTTLSAGGVEAEIGYDKGGVGSLGNLLEYGSIKNGPIPALGPALAAEAPVVEKFIAEVVEKSLRL